MQIWLTLRTGLAIAASMLALPASAAQDPLEIAQAEQEPAEAGSGAAAGEGSAAPARPAPPPAPSGIEEIVILGGESEAGADFESGDSVTGFTAEDLSALGVQSVADLDTFTPNLEIVTTGATTPTFFIRGVGLNDFNANATTAVAVYQDDVQVNAPALQLGTLFDMEAVNVMRGPQGTGLFRSASAGAVKVYSRKPTGDYGGYLSADFGNFDYRDFQGAIEAPIYEDLLAARFAFRLAERAGTAKNGCAGAPGSEIDEAIGPVELWRDESDHAEGTYTTEGVVDTDIADLWNGKSHCGETGSTFLYYPNAPSRFPAVQYNLSPSRLVPSGLPDRVNDLGYWAARGTLLFQPTLDMTWLLSAHGSRRDQQAKLGQSIGTNGYSCLNGDWANCDKLPPLGTGSYGLLGAKDGGGYRPAETAQRLTEIMQQIEDSCPGCYTLKVKGHMADAQLAEELVDLDPEPWTGDYDDVGPTQNDVWGGYLRGEIVLPAGIQLTTVSGYETYDRLIDIDLDFSPNHLFEIRTDDEGWQFTQDLSLQSQYGDNAWLRWDVGALFLMETLVVSIQNDLGRDTQFGVSNRDYTQKLWATGGYGSLAFDFWDKFTLDGGFRWNWEGKTLDYSIVRTSVRQPPAFYKNDWQAPTGTVRLTYRFREDTHAFWKYTRGWKGGHYNATSNSLQDVSIASPETIDSFEVGLRGSWFEGRLGLDLSLFYYNYQDYQIFTAVQYANGPPEFVILNANDAEIYGGELDLVARPLPGTFLNARVGWLESQFLDFVIEQQQRTVGTGGQSGFIVTEVQNSGHRVLNAPEFKVSFTAEQTLPLGRWGSLTARYDGTWTDDVFYDATQGTGVKNPQGVLFLPEMTIGQRANWLHNLRLAYRTPSGNVEIAGWVRNLEDKAYKTFAFDGSAFRNTTIYFVTDPRTFGLSVTTTF